jgi:hypothetical protein
MLGGIADPTIDAIGKLNRIMQLRICFLDMVGYDRIDIIRAKDRNPMKSVE